MFRSSGSGPRFLGSYLEPEIPAQFLYQDYCKVFEYFIGMFPQAVGEDVLITMTRSEFVLLFSGTAVFPDSIPTLLMFERVGDDYADERLACNVV